MWHTKATGPGSTKNSRSLLKLILQDKDWDKDYGVSPKGSTSCFSFVFPVRKIQPSSAG